MPRMVEVEGELVSSTDMAWHFTCTGEERDAKWLPKSLTHWYPIRGEEDAVEGTMEMPGWLAEREGLI